MEETWVLGQEKGESGIEKRNLREQFCIKRSEFAPSISTALP
jgi:hypothetical protein